MGFGHIFFHPFMTKTEEIATWSHFSPLFYDHIGKKMIMVINSDRVL